MNKLLHELASSPWSERLGWTLLHFLWQGTALAVLLAGGLRLFRRQNANVRYTLSCLTLTAMAWCPVATFLSLPVTIHQPAAVRVEAPTTTTKPPPLETGADAQLALRRDESPLPQAAATSNPAKMPSAAALLSRKALGGGTMAWIRNK